MYNTLIFSILTNICGHHHSKFYISPTIFFHVIGCQYIIPFYDWIIFHCVARPLLFFHWHYFHYLTIMNDVVCTFLLWKTSVYKLLCKYMFSFLQDAVSPLIFPIFLMVCCYLFLHKWKLTRRRLSSSSRVTWPKQGRIRLWI